MPSKVRPFASLAAGAAMLLASGLLHPGSAQAVTVDVSSSPIAFPNGATVGANAAVGFSHRYDNVVTVGGVSVDALVTVLSTTGIDRDDTHANGADNLLDNLDEYSASSGNAIRLNLDVFGLDNQSADANFQGETVIRVAFLQSGTLNATTLQNVVINVKDIDSRQFVEFAAISSYVLTTNTEIQVDTNSTAPSLVTSGSTRFSEPLGASSSSSDQENWAQVSYGQLSFVDIKLGARESGSAFFGIEFAAANFTSSTAAVNVTTPSYTVTYNNNGSSDPTPAATTGSGAVTVAAAPSRPGFTFTGWNTVLDGSGISVPASSSLTPSANITLFAQWTAVTTTTVAAPTTTAGAQAQQTEPTSLPATGAERLNLIVAMMGIWLIAMGWANLAKRRRAFD